MTNPQKIEGGKKIETEEFLSKHGFVCHYCGKGASSIDHKLPKSMGGSDDEENLLPACKFCNSNKGSQTYEKFIQSTLLLAKKIFNP